MKQNYFETHSTYKDDFQERKAKYEELNKKYEKDILCFFPKASSGGNVKVLEIGFGIWKFTNFCAKKWFNYTWIDRDWYFMKDLKKDFPNYNFYEISFQDYFKNHKDEYDIIFLSHVFEHLDPIERDEIIEAIHYMLKKWGKWINMMPNAEAVLRSWMWRYGDITHYTVYTQNSFNQVLKMNGLFKEAKSFNSYVWVTSIFHRFIHLIFLFFTKIYHTCMWVWFPKIYTWELISVITKE